MKPTAMTCNEYSCTLYPVSESECRCALKIAVSGALFRERHSFILMRSCSSKICSNSCQSFFVFGISSYLSKRPYTIKMCAVSRECQKSLPLTPSHITDPLI